MTKRIIHFFDKLEDKIRGKLSHIPFLYAFLGGVGVVLFWRGIWHTTDFLTAYLLGETGITLFGLLDGPISFFVGSSILLLTGVYISAFIGSRLIISGLYGEKKLNEKTKEEIETEEDQIRKLQNSVERVEKEISKIESEMKK